MIGLSNLVEDSSSFHVELSGFIIAIDLAVNFSFNNVWLETDSKFVVLVSQDPKIMQWSLKSKWLTALVFVRQMKFKISHILREGILCANMLATKSSLEDPRVVWRIIPSFLIFLLNHDKLGFPTWVLA